MLHILCYVVGFLCHLRTVEPNPDILQIRTVYGNVYTGVCDCASLVSSSGPLLLHIPTDRPFWNIRNAKSLRPCDASICLSTQRRRESILLSSRRHSKILSS